ncbi:MAG: beta-propellerrepeat-containing protein [Devosia sp.]|uniref:PQQ-dependent catabolism-associated beta-propeller protein n=1 Tax=Devosia sp. TaxID=1871048 RepID=UPI002601EE59|nr:PQQ-dependent catabolism-associated beta-propeller protein [Devosia sp.]MDB5538259.1 beta-propellerrepeat-containing protein [Devosia sp.]MDB5587728.1 beta-propellerrepeat-containing protein [Devosia sp.]
MNRLAILAAVAFATAISALPAWAAGTGMIFVSTEKGNEVVVLDQDHNIVKRIETSRRPRDMHFNADKSLLYVACGDDDVIDVIDVTTLEVVDHIPTGPSPEVFAFSPDEKQILVSNEEDSRLEVIDMASRLSVQDIPTGAEPEGVIVSADGKTAYVTSEVADMVHVVDTATGAVTKNILVGTRPRRFILTPDGTELWVSCELSSEIYIIDTATNEIKGDSLIFVPPGFREEDVTPVGMAITKDGSKVLLSLGRANHVAIIDAKSHDVLQYVLVGKRAWSVDLSSDETKAYVANGLSDDITIIDMASMKPEISIPVGRVPHSVMIDD